MAIVTCPKCGAKNRVDERAAERATPRCGKCHTALASGAPDGKPLTVTDSNFQDVLNTAGNKPVLIDAWAEWCPPCKMLGPTIDKIAGESGGRWVIGKLNVDESPGVAQQFRISSIPTMLIFKNGQLKDQLVGLQPKQAIEARLSSV